MSIELNTKISPCLWYNDKAEEAAEWYINLFNTSPHAKSMSKSFVAEKTHWLKEAMQHSQGLKPGTVLSIVFNLAGQEFMAINGGPIFQFTPAVSLMIECADQEEIDHFYDGFSEGVAEREMPCGWVTDRYGLSWQVVPRYIRELIVNESDRTKYNKWHIWMMKSQPKKLILKDVIAAAEGNAADKE